jgi:hypothetical protein
MRRNGRVDEYDNGYIVSTATDIYSLETQYKVSTSEYRGFSPPPLLFWVPPSIKAGLAKDFPSSNCHALPRDGPCCS